MKKILFITPGCFDKGGISRYSRYQITALTELFGKENVKVLSLLGPDQHGFEESFKVFWHGDGPSLKSKISLVFQILKILISWKPTIIHVAHVNFSGLAFYLSKIFKIKTVLNIYGLEIWSGMTWDAKVGLKNVDYIISDCWSTKDHVINNNLRSKGKIEVIWDCVDLEKFKPVDYFELGFLERYNLPEKRNFFIVLTLGRLSFAAAHKGYERLMEVAQKVVKKNRKVKFVFAGKGDMVEHLKELSIKFNVHNHIIFTGAIHENDMASMYAYGDVFSLVSDKGESRGEGIPLTPLEAMASGTPIIVGNQDGSKEAVFEGSCNGVALDPFDLEIHAEKIFEYMSNKEKLKQAQKGALKAVHENFSYEGFKEKHHIFFEKI